MSKPNTIDPADFITKSLSDEEREEILRQQQEEEDRKKKEQEDKEKKGEEDKGGGEKKPKKTKEESISELRAEKDRLEKELQSSKKITDELAGLKSFKSVKDHLEKKLGKPVEDKDVSDFIDRHKEYKKKATELESKLKEKDELIKNFSIEHSEEWNEDFIKPIRKSSSALFTTLAPVNGKGEIVGKEEVASLMQELTKLNEKGEAKTPIEVKQILSKFAKAFEDKHGIEYDIPSLKSVIDGVEEFQSLVVKAEQAKQNWSKYSEETKRAKLIEEEQKRSKFIESEKKARDILISRKTESDDFKKVAEIIGEDEFKKILNDEHKYMQSALTQDDGYKPKGYDTLALSLAKGTAFDILLEKFKAQQKELESIKSSMKGKLPPPKDKQQSGSEEKLIKADGYNPTAFLEK